MLNLFALHNKSRELYQALMQEADRIRVASKEDGSYNKAIEDWLDRLPGANTMFLSENIESTSKLKRNGLIILLSRFAR